MRRITLGLAVLGLVVAGFPAVGRMVDTSAQSPEANTAMHAIIGPWLVTTFVDGQPPTPNLTTFFADGNVLTSNRPVFPPPPGASVADARSAGHGAWLPSTTKPSTSPSTCW